MPIKLHVEQPKTTDTSLDVEPVIETECITRKGASSASTDIKESIKVKDIVEEEKVDPKFKSTLFYIIKLNLYYSYWRFIFKGWERILEYRNY